MKEAHVPQSAEAYEDSPIVIADEGTNESTRTDEHFFTMSLDVSQGVQTVAPGVDPPAEEFAADHQAGTANQTGLDTVDQLNTFDPATARRIADLSSQIDFLNLEVLRYREMLEADRIANAKRLSEAALENDATLDDLRREQREQIAEVHESYRKLLAARQIDFETALSKAAQEHAQQLEELQARHDQQQERTSARRQAASDAARARSTQELTERHVEQVQALERELETSRSLVGRTQYEKVALVEQRKQDLAEIQRLSSEALRKRRSFETLEEHYQANAADLEQQVRTAEARLGTERQRSAATLAELLERSASLAAEADQARADFAAQQAAIEQQAVAAQRQSQRAYDALVEATDERTELAAQRETELEHVIAQLRAELGR